MKKEKQVKAYQRKTSSGKVVTVKAHTAKYDAAEEKAKKAAKSKKGAGDEYSLLKGVNVKDFKDWYLFDDWDTPEESWPESVRVADSYLKSSLGKKGYDEYCAKVDKSWSPAGYVKMHPAYTVNPRPSFPSIRLNSSDGGDTEKKTEELPKKKEPRVSKRKK